MAEIGSAYVAVAMGIEPTVRHADYLNSWLKCLKEDKRGAVTLFGFNELSILIRA
ncbi:zincin-like metallopeptidase domain-containing protein [Phyllobacterium zundukense]|uniref:zincin-like metallopeptidase domain-containing protein n=1 Tax=Phyllobacterium zundukense TaxID=1867719 RepID=UPI003965BD72